MSELLFIALFVLSVMSFTFFNVSKKKRVSKYHRSVAVTIVIFSVIGMMLTVLFYLPNAS
ncbi:hypothetical protein LCL96_08610 [Rossellomorea aquimaris]|uniref:hypothetical protein n=1 Tax=Rossellomorea aquimaris TaxID=189382 RepID=UPI001CD2F6C6|nr:hypothetical protein [Rossellomorea aquimaris]MCA1058995.1 hypothetical protein [Rossellomorea aquimaris]